VAHKHDIMAKISTYCNYNYRGTSEVIVLISSAALLFLVRKFAALILLIRQ